jgi:WD40 repeat protein
VAVGLDGTVYSGSMDATIRAWSGEDGTLLRTLHGHTSAIESIVVGGDGTLFSGSYDKTVRVWCGVTGAARYSLPVDSIAFGLAVAPNGKLYAGLGQHSAVVVW